MGLRLRCLLLTIFMLTPMSPLLIHYDSPSVILDYHVEAVSIPIRTDSTNELSTAIKNDSEKTTTTQATHYSTLTSIAKESRLSQINRHLLQAADVNTSLISPWPPSVYWGWAGNISFSYWDDDNDTGIVNATFDYTIGFLSGAAIDCGNGSYIIHVNTSFLLTGPYRLTVFAWKPGYEPQFGGVVFYVHEVPTDLVLYTPSLNRVNDRPDQLQVPIGDTVEISFLYNDTEPSDGYVGVLSGAEVSCSIWGPTIPVGVLAQAVEVSPGYYNVYFNTTSPEISAAVSGDTYILYIELEMQFRQSNSLLVHIQVIDVSTQADIVSPSLIDNEQVFLYDDETLTLLLSYVDTWHDQQGITGASITANCSDGGYAGILSYQEEPTDPGFYSVVIFTNDTEGVYGPYTCTLSIMLEKENHESQLIQIHVQGILIEPPNPFLPFAAVILSFASVVVLDRSTKYRAGEEDGIETPSESESEAEQTPISVYSRIYFGALLVIAFVIVGGVFIIPILFFALLVIARIGIVPLIPFVLSFNRLRETEKRRDRYIILLVVFCLTVAILGRIFFPPSGLIV